MGFDLYGENPLHKNGEYFRNNVWWWRPLWDYVVLECEGILSKKDIASGGFNNGYVIDETKTLKIAKRLSSLVQSGETKKYENEYAQKLASLPLVQCDICEGAGKRNDKFVQGQCNACDGKGKCPNWATHYPFEEKNVKQFIQFCKNSGGFSIC